MPWKELCSVNVREKFVLEALDGRVAFSMLCTRIGISRKTGYKWLRRYKQYGVRGLEDMSRSPRSCPLATTADVVAEVVAVRKDHPAWGPKKIREVLKREGVPSLPVTRTIARILERTGFLQPMRRRRRWKHEGSPPQLEVRKPNDVWTVDFKGWWLATGTHERCEPLTIRDAHSRFIIDIRVLATTRGDVVKRAFEDAFRRYGLPRAILTDNGSPFASATGALRLTYLTVWWLSLGIDVQHSRPATPSDNGGHERMHRDMKAELQRFAALTRRKQQAACDRWRHEFNHHRPHEALQMKTPAEFYRPSSVRYDGREVAPTYPEPFLSRRVSNSGTVSVGGTPLFVSMALRGRVVGLEPQGFDKYRAWFGGRRLADLDFATRSMQPCPTGRAPPLASLAAPRRAKKHPAAA